MSLNELGEWVLDFVNSEQFADWISTSLFGVAMWWMGYADKRKQLPLSVPQWLIPFLRQNMSSDGLVYVRSFVMQIGGTLSLIWSFLLVVIVTNHKQRIDLFFGGYFVLWVLALLFIVIQRLKG